MWLVTDNHVVNLDNVIDFCLEEDRNQEQGRIDAVTTSNHRITVFGPAKIIKCDNWRDGLLAAIAAGERVILSEELQ